MTTEQLKFSEWDCSTSNFFAYLMRALDNMYVYCLVAFVPWLYAVLYIVVQFVSISCRNNPGLQNLFNQWQMKQLKGFKQLTQSSTLRCSDSEQTGSKQSESGRCSPPLLGFLFPLTPISTRIE